MEADVVRGRSYDGGDMNQGPSSYLVPGGCLSGEKRKLQVPSSGARRFKESCREVCHETKNRLGCIFQGPSAT